MFPSHVLSDPAPTPVGDLYAGIRSVMSHGTATIVIALYAVAAMCPTPAWAQQGPAAPPSVTVARPVTKVITEHDDFIGRFEAVDTVDLRARVTGYLDKVHFEDGAILKAGDLLFTIDQRPYRTAEQEAAATLASTSARVEFATTDLERAQNLRQTGNIAEQIFDQRRQILATARADQDRATATLARAKLDLDYTEIRAPITGRVSRRLVSVGNLIAANETLLTTMVSLDPIQFYLDVDERSYLAYLQGFATKPGGASSRDPTVLVRLTGETVARRAGRIDFIDVRLDQSSGTVRGRAVFENRDHALTPGMFGRVSVPGSVPYKAILVPDEAIGTDQDRRVVYVVGEDNKVATKVVRPGPRVDGYRLIREGLDGTERIVVVGLSRARPGSLVTPKVIDLPPERLAGTD